MRNAVDIITDGKRKALYKPILLYIIYDLFRGAPYGFLIMVLWDLFAPVIDLGHIMFLMGAMVLTYLIQYIVGKYALVSVHETGYSLCSEARLNLGEHLRKLPMGFFKGRDPGDITQLMLQDMTFVENIFTHLMADIVAAFTLPIILILFMVVLDIKLALVAVITILISFPFLLASQVLVRKYGGRLSEIRVSSGARLLEYLHGIRYIKAYNLTGKRFRVLDESLDNMHKAILRLEIVPGIAATGYMSMLGLGYVILLLVATYYFMGGTLTIPVYLVFLILGYQLYQPLIQAGLDIMEVRFMSLAANRMKEVLDEKPLTEPENPKTPNNFSVSFLNVTFGYHENTVLSDVSFSVSPGEVLALVGPSGSGKTTITNLIARFWDVNSGKITLGGVDIRDIGTEKLLSYMSMVFQDVYLFNDTIRNNILIGKPDATDEEIIAASKSAQAHDFIVKLPKGYDTIIGEGGSTISGGEKQRISIARALLKDAPIILLDEATASIDPENEQAIQTAISALIKSKTVIVIAHRLNTIQDADRIIVIDHGKVTESGRHQELLAQKGMYFRMWSEQEKASHWTVSSAGISEKLSPGGSFV
ncbi:ABC transporter ATP-binding protein [Methanospirillum stamsii]|uniref:ABC transporter ATP-binding protein n=1 Tax=Methanospirillum stamsii TaxID=1277351 RepID=A0A2V2N2R6_9EURY|nr:ABC transporter ATP-binding protein [Methanospirillum stamsii]PWR74544.1 ABC transporter ATP-binding protein [Methanospirillum stamsii]